MEEKTYNREDAPRGERWFRDIFNIAEKLSKEKIYSEIFIDSQLEDKIREYTIKDNYIKMHSILLPSDMPKIGYTRDQSVTWMRNPIIGNIALDIRKGEENVISEIYEQLNMAPLIRVR